MCESRTNHIHETKTLTRKKNQVKINPPEQSLVQQIYSLLSTKLTESNWESVHVKLETRQYGRIVIRCSGEKKIKCPPWFNTNTDEIRWYKDLWEMSALPQHSWHCISVHQFQFVWMFPMLNGPVHGNVCMYGTVQYTLYILKCGQAYVCSTLWWMCVCITDYLTEGKNIFFVWYLLCCNFIYMFYLFIILWDIVLYECFMFPLRFCMFQLFFVFIVIVISSSSIRCPCCWFLFYWHVNCFLNI